MNLNHFFKVINVPINNIKCIFYHFMLFFYIIIVSAGYFS